MSYSLHFLQALGFREYSLRNLMDMGSLLGTLFWTVLNYNRDPMSTTKGPLMRQILTVADMGLVVGSGYHA